MAFEQDLSASKGALREDLTKEYYALLDLTSRYGDRLITIKGWSVTLSLAGLGLGFQQQHYSLFGLAAATALAFWVLEALVKGYQARYFFRMRDIEYTHYHLNRVKLGELGYISAPRIETTWYFIGDPKQDDWRTDPPHRYKPCEIRRQLRGSHLMRLAMLPHLIAVLLGTALFFYFFFLDVRNDLGLPL